MKVELWDPESHQFGLSRKAVPGRRMKAKDLQAAQQQELDAVALMSDSERMQHLCGDWSDTIRDETDIIC